MQPGDRYGKFAQQLHRVLSLKLWEGSFSYWFDMIHALCSLNWNFFLFLDKVVLELGLAMGSVKVFRWISGYPVAVADQGFNGSPESCGSWHHGCNRVPHQQDRQTIFFGFKIFRVFWTSFSTWLWTIHTFVWNYRYVLNIYDASRQYIFFSGHHNSQANVSYAVGSVNPPFVLHDWNSLPPVKAGLEITQQKASSDMSNWESWGNEKKQMECELSRQKIEKSPPFCVARISLLRAQNCPSLLVERDAIGQSHRSHHREDEQRVASESVFVLEYPWYPKEASKSSTVISKPRL